MWHGLNLVPGQSVVERIFTDPGFVDAPDTR
jgi:hypothetical protein